LESANPRLGSIDKLERILIFEWSWLSDNFCIYSAEYENGRRGLFA